MNTVRIRSYYKNGEQILTRIEAQRLLKIANRGVLRAHLKAIGKSPHPDSILNWEDIRELLILRSFLRIGIGKHSVQQFAQIRELNLIPELCERFNINPQSELEKLQNGYRQEINQY